MLEIWGSFRLISYWKRLLWVIYFKMIYTQIGAHSESKKVILNIGCTLWGTRQFTPKNKNNCTKKKSKNSIT